MIEWLEVVVPIVKECGEKARWNLLMGKNKGSRKKQGDWVTKTDKDVEAKIIEGISHYFPDHAFLGEESGIRGDAQDCWVIDPIDGTTNFVHGFPQSAISVAYCYQGKPQLAIIYEYINDNLFTAVTGNGTYLNGERIRVSKTDQFASSLFIASGQINPLWPLVGRLSAETDGARRTGSTVLDLAYLAAGKADAVISGPVNFWDVAAGVLLIKEAGGLVADINNQTQFEFNARTNAFVAATPKLFARYLSETKQFLLNKESES